MCKESCSSDHVLDKRYKEGKEIGSKEMKDGLVDYMNLMKEVAVETTRNIVINMIINDINDDFILKCTKLTKEQLDEIKEELR